MKIAVNRCYGGFSVSQAVYDELGIPWDNYGYLENKHFEIESYDFDAFRSHPKLIEALEKLGKSANGRYAKIEIVDIPDDVDWEIHDYDGNETIHEKHRTW